MATALVMWLLGRTQPDGESSVAVHLEAPRRPVTNRRPHPGPAAGQRRAGATLVVVVGLLGLILAVRPGPLPVDRWAQSVFTARQLAMVDRVTVLGSLSALGLGTALCALVAWGQGLRRTLACACGPVLAAATAEVVLKPVVGRHLDGALTFPSGTVVVVAALSTTLTLAVSSRSRWLVGALGMVITLASMVAVVSMRWHYASDALAGAGWGAGVVVLADGLLQGGWHPREQHTPAVPSRNDPLADPCRRRRSPGGGARHRCGSAGAHCRPSRRCRAELGS